MTVTFVSLITCGSANTAMLECCPFHSTHGLAGVACDTLFRGAIHAGNTTCVPNRPAEQQLYDRVERKLVSLNNCAFRTLHSNT